MHNSKYQCLMAACCSYDRPTDIFFAAKQEPYEKYCRIFWKKYRRVDQLGGKDETERVTGLGRTTREEIKQKSGIK